MNEPAPIVDANEVAGDGAGVGSSTESDSTRQVLRLNHVVLEHIRCFARLEVDLHPRLTVFVAENGGGKSTVALACGVLTDCVGSILSSSGSAPVWMSSAARLARDSSQHLTRTGDPVATCVGMVAHELVEWSVSEKDPNQRMGGSTGLQRLQPVAQRIVRASQDIRSSFTQTSNVLPICRSLSAQRDFERQMDGASSNVAPGRLNSRLETYLIDDLQRVRFDAFVQWFEALSLELAQEQMTGRPSPHKPDVLLEAIRRPVERVLEHTGWTRLIWDYAERDLMAEHPQLGTLPVAELSDGIRTMIALVGDLAHRAVRLNRHLGVEAARLTPGVVVIDEVDVHLHPRWQQSILGLLMEAFPLVQFIVTTHSPQVISTVPRECIRVLSCDADGIGHAVTPEFSPLGQDAGAALAHIFDTPTRPDLPVLAHLHAYEMYVRHGQEDLPEAQAALARLTEAGVEIPEADLDLWRFLAKRLAAK